MALMHPNTSYSGPLWHVCYVEPRTEIRACEDITDELGFEAYAPVERLKRPVRGVLSAIERPLFPRYIFVGVDPYRQEWQRLLDIAGILGTNGAPGCVPAAWIAMIRKMEECGVFDRTKVEPDKFKIGDIVRVSEGPFSGLTGRIESFAAKLKNATASKRVKLLMDFCHLDMDVTGLERLDTTF
jgi:transcriptional antiterminator RfaH